MLPPTVDWKGNLHSQSYVSLAKAFALSGPSELSSLVEHGVSHLEALLPFQTRLTSSCHSTSLTSFLYEATRDKPQPMKPPSNPVAAISRLELDYGTTQKYDTTYLLGSRASKLCSVKGHSSMVVDIQFDVLSQRFFTAALDGCLKVWDANTGWLIRTIRTNPSTLSDGDVCYVSNIDTCFGNRLLATCSTDNVVRIWDLESYMPLQSLSVDKDIYCIAFSPSPIPDRQCLVVGCNDGKTRVFMWNVTTKRFYYDPVVYKSASRPSVKVSLVSFSMTGTMFVTGCSDGILDLFTLTDIHQSSKPIHPDSVDDDHGSDQTFTNGRSKQKNRKRNGSLEDAWMVSPRMIKQFGDHSSPITDVNINQRGDAIYSCDKDGVVFINRLNVIDGTWSCKKIDARDLEENETAMVVDEIPATQVEAENNTNDRSREQTPPPNPQDSQITTPGSRQRSSRNAARTPTTPQVPTEERKKQKHAETLNVELNADESLLIVSYSDSYIHIYDATNGEFLRKFRGHIGSLTIIAHPTYKYLLASVGYDGKCILWDCNKAVILSQFEFPDQLLTVAFSPNGDYLLIGDNVGGSHLLGFENTCRYAETPQFQFFKVDSKTVRVDTAGTLCDDESQIPVYMLPLGNLLDQSSTEYNQPIQSKRQKQVDTLNYESLEDVLELNLEQRKAFLKDEKTCGVVDTISGQAPQLIDQRTLLKRRTMIQDPDEEAVAAQLAQVPIVPLPPSSGDEYDEPEVGEEGLRHTIHDEDDDDSFSGNDGSEIYDFASDEEEEDGQTLDSEGLILRNGTNLVPRRKKRREFRRHRRARRNTSNDDEEEGESETTNSKSGEESSDWGELDGEPRPSRSRTSSFEINISPHSRNKRKPKYDNLVPSPWVSTDTQQLYPYLPQIGDTVVYIKSAHRVFLSKTSNVIDDVVDETLADIAYMRIQELDFFVGPPLLCRATFKVLEAPEDSINFPDPSELQVQKDDLEGTEIETIITIGDIRDAPQFLILYSTFAQSVYRPWNIGDRVVARHHNDDYAAIITTIRVQDDPWRKYVVEFEDYTVGLSLDAGSEVFSSWELRGADTPSGENKETIRPSCVERIQSIVREMMKQEDMAVFYDPVAYKKFPSYLEFNPYPMNIRFITDRLDKGFYRRMESLIWDIQLMLRNAIVFNEADSLIARLAEAAFTSLIAYILDEKCFGYEFDISGWLDANEDEAESRVPSDDGKGTKRRNIKNKAAKEGTSSRRIPPKRQISEVQTSSSDDSATEEDDIQINTPARNASLRRRLDNTSPSPVRRLPTRVKRPVSFSGGSEEWSAESEDLITKTEVMEPKQKKGRPRKRMQLEHPVVAKKKKKEETEEDYTVSEEDYTTTNSNDENDLMEHNSDDLHKSKRKRAAGMSSLRRSGRQR